MFMEENDIRSAAAGYLLKEAALLFLVLDPEGRIIDANRYCRDLAGDVIGKPLTDLVLDFTGSFSFSALRRTPHDVRLLNIRTLSGLPQTFYFRFLDLGEQLLAFGEINSLEIETLRKNLLSANNELSNLGRELQKKNAELVKLNDLKNQFLGMAAHDLRNPIGVILSYSDFILEEAGEALGEEHRQFLTTIRKSSDFMLSMLNDLLDITKIESGRLELEIEAADLTGLVEQNVVLNRVLAAKKSIQIRIQRDAGLPPARVDRGKIQQVLNNLISNAVKFSPAGTTVTVRVFRSGDEATVSVKDEGPGIPDAERQKLFQPFSRTSVKSTGGEKSTGLGLAIAKKIILGHRGKIWAESGIGGGSTFYFTLPLELEGA
jgi:signal transduction histidine kinase